MSTSPSLLAAMAVLLAVLLDRLIGDPINWTHPVIVMGWWIQRLRLLAERTAGDTPWMLRLAGGAITVVMVGISALCGWLVEQLALGHWVDGATWWMVLVQLLLVIGLASALAGRSLELAVKAVLEAINDNDQAVARQRLQWIVGRDTRELNTTEILRAAAETAAENSVDGLFAPLFWMLVGLVTWSLFPAGPGPLALAWGFKATSTLDSMLGYKRDRLRWLGTAGARLDDLMVWIPCRLVMVTLPLVSQPWRRWPTLVKAAERDGRPDSSPNAGRAEAIFAHCTGVRLGGRNRYGDRWVEKPLLAADQPAADPTAILRILGLSQRLSALWMLAPAVLILAQIAVNFSRCSP